MDKAQAIAADAKIAKQNPDTAADYSAHPDLNDDGTSKLEFPDRAGVFTRNADGSLQRDAAGELVEVTPEPAPPVPNAPRGTQPGQATINRTRVPEADSAPLVGPKE